MLNMNEVNLLIAPLQQTGPGVAIGEYRRCDLLEMQPLDRAYLFMFLREEQNHGYVWSKYETDQLENGRLPWSVVKAMKDLGYK